jgi:calcineurin-like phosphoesterase family protein
MDEAMISNWNGLVADDDLVYHLGDFGALDCVLGVRGRLLFLPGNYDAPDFVQAMAAYGQIIEPNTLISVGGHQFQLVHQPDQATPSEHFFLFGHIHNLQMVKRNGLNVGVDCHHFAPISLETVLYYQRAIQHYYDENVFMNTLGGV